MAFCTQLEWDSGFPFERYEEIAGRAGSHDSLPQGCLVRVVGRKDSGAYILEVWESSDDAKRYGERSAALLKEFRMPMPSRSAAFETVIFETR